MINRFSTGVPRPSNRKRLVSSTMVLGQLDIHMQKKKNRVGPHLIPYTAYKN